MDRGLQGRTGVRFSVCHDCVATSQSVVGCMLMLFCVGCSVEVH